MTHHGWYVLTVFRHAEISLKCEMVHGQISIHYLYVLQYALKVISKKLFAIYQQNINGFQ